MKIGEYPAAGKFDMKYYRKMAGVLESLFSSDGGTSDHLY